MPSGHHPRPQQTESIRREQSRGSTEPRSHRGQDPNHRLRSWAEGPPTLIEQLQDKTPDFGCNPKTLDSPGCGHYLDSPTLPVPTSPQPHPHSVPSRACHPGHQCPPRPVSLGKAAPPTGCCFIKCSFTHFRHITQASPTPLTACDICRLEFSLIFL